MTALAAEEITRIELSYRELGSLRRVAKLLSRSPNTVKKYASRTHPVRTQTRVRALNTADDRLIGVYVGLWMGDGSQYYDNGYTVKICCDRDRPELNAFIAWLIETLFGRRPHLNTEKGTRRAVLKMSSKFVYTFIDAYVARGEHKTHTVRLKEPLEHHSTDFLEGCLLGLALSDGSLKDRFYFNVTSPGLAANMRGLLERYGFSPNVYVHRRRKYGWKDLHLVSLVRRESDELERLLDGVLEKCGSKTGVKELKNEPAGI